MVDKVDQIEDGKLRVKCQYKDQTYKLIAGSVVHCWNGYGAKDKFLPARLSSKIENNRIQVVGMKNEGVQISKNICYNQDHEDTEEFLIQ